MATVQVIERLIAAMNAPVSPTVVATTTQAPQANDLIVVIGLSNGSSSAISAVTGLGATWTRQRQVEQPLPIAGASGSVEVWLGRGATAAGAITATHSSFRGRVVVYHLRASDGAFISAAEMGTMATAWTSLSGRERYLKAGDLLVAANANSTATGAPTLSASHAFDAGSLSIDDGIFVETGIAHRTAVAEETVTATVAGASGTRTGVIATLHLSTDPVEKVEVVGYSTHSGGVTSLSIPFNSVQFRSNDIAVLTVAAQNDEDAISVAGLGGTWTKVHSQAIGVSGHQRLQVWFGTGLTSPGFATLTVSGGSSLNGTAQGFLMRGLQSDDFEVVSGMPPNLGDSVTTLTTPALAGQPGELMIGLAAHHNTSGSSNFPNPGVPAGWRGAYLSVSTAYGFERVAARAVAAADESHTVTYTSSSASPIHLALLRVGIPAAATTPLAVTLDAVSELQVTLTAPPPPVLAPTMSAASSLQVTLPEPAQLTYQQTVLADAPVLYWRLDETSGNTVADLSGNGYHGARGNAAVLGKPGLVSDGKAVSFPQTTGKVVASSVPELTAAQFAIEAWIKTTATQGGILGNSDRYWYLNGGGIVVPVGGGFFDTMTYAINDGIRHHVVHVQDGAESRLYVDGVLRDSIAMTKSTALTVFGLGVLGNNNSSGMVGLADEVAFYDHALSEARIAAHYAAGGEEQTSAPLGPIALAAVTSLEVTLTAGVPTLGTVILAATSSLSVTFPARDAALAVTLAASSGLLVTLPPARPRTARNSVGGRSRSGVGVINYSPPVVEPPFPAPAAHVEETAQAFGHITFIDGRPYYDVDQVAVERDRDRIVVGGKDITFLNGAPTPTPDYALVSPLMYGTGTLRLPQVPLVFIEPGKGAYRWLRKGAPVRVQRVRDGVVVATDYKGVIVDWAVDGAGASVQLGGELSGRAALTNRQLPLITRTFDVGRYAFSVARTLGVRFKPFLGPETGIRFERFGGASNLEYLNELCARAVRRNGDQFTIMPGADGAYRMELKDRTTIHATAYFDDNRLKPTLRSDMAEEPNRIFATGVTPQGMKVKFGHYPGLQQGPAPDWPLAPAASFGLGDDGEHVQVLMWTLVTFGYLRVPDSPGGYDADVVEAVEELQDEAGLPVTGRVDRATWRALFDLDVTGYSLVHTAIHPAAQRRSVRKWNYTPSGAHASKNEHYDPHRLKVDRNVNFGTGFTRQQMRKWARAQLADAATDNWIGTLDLSAGSEAGGMALIAGEHNPGDPAPTAADVMRARDLRPGMNVWAPTFMGGTLFHVSGVEVADRGQSVKVTIDTRARDTMPAWEVITRNRESRRNPARVWLNQYRSSTIDKDAIITYDEMGGVLREGVELEAGWNVIPVVAGQEGTIARLRLELTNELEFATAVFGRKVSEKWLDRRIPAPLAKTRNDQGGAGVPWYEQRKIRKELRERIMLFAVGTHDEPCGIGDSRKIDGQGNATAAQVTGVFDDEASFGFHTFAAPVLYLCVWVPQETKLRRGRVMWPQQEEGS